MESYLQTYVLDGGILMAAILPCAFLALGAIVQAMIRLRRSRVMPGFIAERAHSAKAARDLAGFARELRGQSSPLARAVALTLKEFDWAAGERPSERELDVAAGDAAAEAAEEMYDGLGIFATLYTIGPLFGLLGTVFGMIHSFGAFAKTADRTLDLVSAGIQKSLISTLWGIGVAIPCFVAYQAFHAKVRRYERTLLPEKAAEIVGSMMESGAAREGEPAEPGRAEAPIAPPIRSERAAP